MTEVSKSRRDPLERLHGYQRMMSSVFRYRPKAPLVHPEFEISEDGKLTRRRRQSPVPAGIARQIGADK